MTTEPITTVFHIVREAKGGMRKHVLQLLGGLNRKRFRLSLVGAHELVAALGKNGIHDIKLLQAPIGDGLGLRAVIALPRIARFVRRSPAPRIIHAHGYTAAVLGVAVAALSGAKLVYTAHNLLSPAAAYVTKMAARIASGRADRIIAVSEGVKRSLEQIGVPAGRIDVIPNGVQLQPPSQFDRASKLAELGLPDEAGIVLCIARLTPVKGVRYLIEATPALRREIPDSAVVIVGDGPETESLKQLDHKVNGKHGALFLGYRQDASELMMASDVVAIPSVQEGQGLVAMEAMALGRPVVAAAVGGLTETISDGVTGLLVAPHDPASLAGGIARILKDPALAEELGNAGRDFVTRERTVEKMVLATEAVYRECAKF